MFFLNLGLIFAAQLQNLKPNYILKMTRIKLDFFLPLVSLFCICRFNDFLSGQEFYRSGLYGGGAKANRV